jgi:hypothetical protein
MKKILRASWFSPDPKGHGGNRRTLQIEELVTSLGLMVEDTQLNLSIRLQRRLERVFNGFNFINKYNYFTYPLHCRLSYLEDIFIDFNVGFNHYQGTKVILWESTNNYTIPYLAKKNGFTIIALPHNIESLVVNKNNNFASKSLPFNFRYEIKNLAKADKLFSISREEQWLLKLYGIDADFLPYYPPKEILNYLLTIRKDRKDSQKKRFLIIGTANNYPTMQGMIEQIKWLKVIKKEFDYEIDIAGYGTENLKEYCCDSSINILGSLDSKKLYGLLVNAKAVLVHQKIGTGALTRITEMVIAGIPVIANSSACRSAFDFEGVYCYEDKSELLNLMWKTFDMPNILLPPIESEKRFLNYISSFI